jgi:hypothetical protein
VAGGPIAGTNETITNSYGIWNVGKLRNDGIVTITNTTDSTTTSTGSLVLSGGLGVAKNIVAAGIQNTPIGSTTASTGAFTTVTTSGTLAVNNTIALTESSVYYSGTNSTNTTPRYNFGLQVHNTSNTGSNSAPNLILFTDLNSTQAAIGGYRLNYNADFQGGLLFLVGSQPAGYTQATPSTITQASNSLTEAMRITPGSQVLISGTLNVSSSQSGTPSATGAYIQSASSTFTDNNTTASGTAATMVFNSIATPTLAATNTSVTTTNAATFYVAGGPSAGTNETITNSYGIWNVGKLRNDGNVQVNANVNITGSLTKGSGTFDIPHPIPEKAEKGYRLRHSFVESNNAGDNLYRYKIKTKNLKYTIELPEYFSYLNKDVQIFISPYKHFGSAYGEYSESNTVEISANFEGEYNVLIVGTRKDLVGETNWNEFGVEYVKN